MIWIVGAIFGNFNCQLELPTEAAVGDALPAQIRCTHSKNDVAMLPERLNLGTNWLVLKPPSHFQRARSENQTLDTHLRTFIPLESGKQKLPPIPIHIGARTAWTEPAWISVSSQLSSMEGSIADQRRQLEAQAAPDPDFFEISEAENRWFFIDGLILLGLLFLGVWWFRRRLRFTKPQFRSPTEALLALQKSKAPLSERYTELSRILRASTGLSTPLARTFTEIQSNLVISDAQILSELLVRTEKIKYANESMTDTGFIEDIERALKWFRSRTTVLERREPA